MDIMTMIVVVIALVAVFTLIVTRMAFKHEENQMQAMYLREQLQDEHTTDNYKQYKCHYH